MTIEEWLGKDNTLGIDIWKKKYQRNSETFEEWLDRVSGGSKEVKELIQEKKFLFGGRILSNRGVDSKEEKTTYSNCYVLTTNDSIEAIYETCKKLARTYSYGGGVGIDISKLAPSGAKVRNQAKNTSGAVSFMDTFSQVTEQIGQNGRRGALMISMDCRHPDIRKFITVKSDLNKVNYANISVKVTDEFMEAVKSDADWTLTFTRPETKETIEETVKAKELFDLICEQNWDYAEPGVLFWDTIRNYNLLNNNPEFEYAGVNPCAEEPLPDGGACLLGSLNLAAFVNEETKEFERGEFSKAVAIAITALNDVLDEGMDKHPLKEQRQCAKDWRQCGLGIMGLADCLIKMGLKYGGKESIEICNMIGNILASEALATSAKLAKADGAYPQYNDLVLESSFYKKHEVFIDIKTKRLIKENGLRNSQLLTIAPTGTLSTMLGISGGIEPIFANSYTRMTKSLHGEDYAYKVYTPIVAKYMENNDITDESDLPEYFVTSATIPVKDRINMQAVWQSHIDASISSTVNLPNEATVDDVKEIYISAWEKGLKGITVFRAGCARTSILTSDSEKEREKKTAKMSDTSNLDVIGLEHHLTTGCGSLHICAYFDKQGNLKNTYLSKGSSGGCNNFMIGLSRMISLAARNGVPIEDIVDQLHSCGTCPSYAVRRATKKDVSPGSCCPVAIGNALMEMRHKFNNDVNIPKEADDMDTCPECGGVLKHEMGCVTCINCGYSKCN